MALDFNSLTPEAATIAPKVVGARRVEIPEQVLTWLQNSFGKPMGIPVVASDVKEFVAMLQTGAERLNLGIRVRVVDSKKNEFVPNTDVYAQLEGKSNKMRVVWETKTRSKRPRKPKTVETVETVGE